MTIVFVYNAEAGLVNGIMDSIHKIVSPSTYSCDLCAITHGLARQRPEWRAWLKKSGQDAKFYHRSDFRQAWPDVHVTLPAVLVQEADQLRLIASASDLAQINNVSELVALLDARRNGGKIDDPAL